MWAFALFLLFYGGSLALSPPPRYGVTRTAQPAQLRVVSMSMSPSSAPRDSVLVPGSSVTLTKGTSATAPAVVEMNLLHLPALFNLVFTEFQHTCRTEDQVFALKSEILLLFGPKLVFRWLMGNYLIGLELENQLVGFVDLSLQPQSIKALEVRPLVARQVFFGSDNLRPYLCNLLVSPLHRKKGFGKKLVRACLDTSKKWGYSDLFLHVEPKEEAAVALYKSCGLKAVKSEGDTTLMHGIF